MSRPSCMSSRRQRGLSTVEYAVAGALMTVGVVMSFTSLGGAVDEAIGNLAGSLQVADAGSGAGSNSGIGGGAGSGSGSNGGSGAGGSSGSPGNSGSAPGQSGSPGNSGSAPGQTGNGNGNGGKKPR